MSDRRMFSKRIISSARFIKMPVSSQALYFHLALNADDDGIVEAFQIMKMTASSEDDLKVLVAKDFIKILNEDMVTFVTNWTEHNLIRPDRKIDSIYKDLLLQIIPDADIVIAQPRSDVKDNSGRVKQLPMLADKKDDDVETPGEIARKFFNDINFRIKILPAIGFPVSQEIDKFVSHWTEPTRGGKKVRWELEPTFDVKRRLKRWFDNVENWKKTTKPTPTLSKVRIGPSGERQEFVPGQGWI